MPKTKKNPKILVIHGPNLNMLGKREPGIYGHLTLAKINRNMRNHAAGLGFLLETFQSNHEGAIVDKIQKAMGTMSGLVINPAAYTHTSIAIRDALLLLDIPIVEVHLSDISKREPFRHFSYVSDVASAQISGLGADGYLKALDKLAELIA